MVRKSPDSRGSVDIGTIERGNDGDYWERVEQRGTGGVWRKTWKAKEFQSQQTKQETKRIKRKRTQLKKKIKALERKDEKEEK